MSENCSAARQDTLERLVAYSAAAGLGAFAFGQDSLAAVVYTDIPDLVINRGDPSLDIDFDNDGYNDVLLLHTAGGGFGDYGTVQWRGSAYWGLPGSSTEYPNRGAGYSLTNTAFGGTYYVRSFDTDDVIGPGNSYAQTIDLSPGYGLVPNYGGYGEHAFWDANAFAGVKFVDANGQNARYGWARFQITIHDVTGSGGVGGPDGTVDESDYWLDPNRFVTVFDYAYETTPDTDIIAGDMGSPSLTGDMDGDGFVGISDLNIVLGNWNQNVPAGNKLMGDPSGDGFVGIEDLNTVLGDWNNGTPPAADAAVPEPTSLALLAAGGGALAFRRRRA